MCLDECTIKMFADDTLIYVKGKSSVELERNLNMSLNTVENWMNRNKLKMNAEKTKYMIARSVRKKMKGNIVSKCVDGTEWE